MTRIWYHCSWCRARFSEDEAVEALVADDDGGPPIKVPACPNCGNIEGLTELEEEE